MRRSSRPARSTPLLRATEVEDSGVVALGTTPSVLNLAGLEADHLLLEELRSHEPVAPIRSEAPAAANSHRLAETVNAPNSSMLAFTDRGAATIAGDASAELKTAPFIVSDKAPSPTASTFAPLGGSPGLGGKSRDATGGSALFDVSLPLLQLAMTNVVDDSFTRCFKSQKRQSWNWNAYLWPAWAIGFLFRYLILFPLRLFVLALGFLTVGTLFPLVKVASLFTDTRRAEKALIQLLATAFVTSWSGVIRIHGLRPTPRHDKPAGVFVANHSTMCDFIILLQSHPYAVVGQHHPGWVGFLQDYLLDSINCVWFNRGETKDRRIVAERLRSHAHDVRKADTPLLVFPEGTCVNNEYVIQFKKGVFELGVPINPVAIKYNKVFVDAYWNSRQQSFAQHLFGMMTSWAVVCDVWFLDQQTIRPGESPAAFAQRVQRLIAARAGLKAVDWDGYMKYWRPNARFVQQRQRQIAASLLAAAGIDPAVGLVAEGNAAAATAAPVAPVVGTDTAKATQAPAALSFRPTSNGDAQPDERHRPWSARRSARDDVYLGDGLETPAQVEATTPVAMPAAVAATAAAEPDAEVDAPRRTTSRPTQPATDGGSALRVVAPAVETVAACDSDSDNRVRHAEAVGIRDFEETPAVAATTMTTTSRPSSAIGGASSSPAFTCDGQLAAVASADWQVDCPPPAAAALDECEARKVDEAQVEVEDSGAAHAGDASGATGAEPLVSAVDDSLAIAAACDVLGDVGVLDASSPGPSSATRRRRGGKARIQA